MKVEDGVELLLKPCRGIFDFSSRHMLRIIYTGTHEYAKRAEWFADLSIEPEALQLVFHKL